MSFLERASGKNKTDPFSVADFELPPLEIEPLREEPASPMPLREEPASPMPLREEPAAPLDTAAELQLQLQQITSKIDHVRKSQEQPDTD